MTGRPTRPGEAKRSTQEDETVRQVRGEEATTIGRDNHLFSTIPDEESSYTQVYEAGRYARRAAKAHISE